MGRNSTDKAIKSLIQKLNLPIKAQYSQDWEYEVSKAERIAEFIECYEDNLIDEDEKFTLMIILIGSCDDALEEGNLNQALWERIKACLIKDRDIHADTINYWALQDNDDLNDCFKITPLIRGL